MRRLHGHHRRTPAEVLESAAAWCRDRGVTWDAYGTGGLIQDLEQRVAERLGFPAGRFMPSGTMAQPIALRVWAGRSGTSHVGMHPTAHLELHEERGYAHLHGLRATLVGPRDRPLLASHLRAVAEPMSALLVELPVREAGGQLPTWDELQELKGAALELGIALHLDGARLWECGPAYDKPYDEICDGFSSAYVSFYKGIGALPGAMLLGPESFVAEAAVWQRRQGGTLHSVLPSVVTASMHLDARLAEMPSWFEHAKKIAWAIATVPGVRVLPDPPHTNLFHVVLELDAQVAMERAKRVGETQGIRPFGWARPALLDGACRTEIHIGSAAMDVAPEEAAAAFAALFVDP